MHTAHYGLRAALPDLCPDPSPARHPRFEFNGFPNPNYKPGNFTLDIQGGISAYKEPRPQVRTLHLHRLAIATSARDTSITCKRHFQFSIQRTPACCFSPFFFA